MPATTLPCALLALALVGCASSHPPGPGAPCTLDPDGGSACPEGMACELASRATGARTCRVLCDDGAGLVGRCVTGEACVPAFEGGPRRPATCWPGGALAEGEECRNTFACGRGLWCAHDLSTADEHLSRCEPVCDDDSHCTGTGERCIASFYCAPPCDPAVPSTCPTDSVCVTGFCLWSPRAADCNRDGEPDCPLGEICSTRTVDLVCWDPADYPHAIWP